MADKFVKMTMEGETIEVSPLAVEDHKSLGWKVVDEGAPAKAEEVAAEAPAPKKTTKK